MKGAVLALFCAIVALASAEINENGCPVNPYVDILKPHSNCNNYYQCVQGDLITRKCASTTVFNAETQQCDYPENVDCGDRNPVAPDSSDESGNDSDGDDNGNEDIGTGENSGTDENSNSSSDSGSEDGDSDNNGGSGNGNPSEAADICATEGSNGVLMAHENCNQFYKCSEGVPVTLNCQSNLLFNPANDQCDWPENVNCDGRNTEGENEGNGDNGNGDSGNEENGNENNSNGDNSNEDNSNGDNGNGESDNGNNGGSGNGNPSEALEICAAEGSDDVLVAHENCNQFYKCSEGVPVTLNCQSNLLFNPANDQCDWPENVNCEGRNTESENDGNGDNGNGDSENEENGNEDNGNGDNSNEDNSNGDNGNGDNSDEGNDNGDSNNGSNGDGGNSNPSEAPKICAAEGSDGVLVAHENCNQFYKCSEGVPVTLNCLSNLLFNPANDQCDWPENVNCEGRNTESENNGNGDNGNGDSGNEENGNEDNENGDNSNEDNSIGDNGNGDNSDEGNDNGDSDNGNNGDGGNSNPSDATEICAAEGSDGVLVAHENCNQFYKCSEGVSVALDCNLNLLFNPANGQCDWPENVDCGSRNRFTSFNKHMRFRM